MFARWTGASARQAAAAQLSRMHLANGGALRRRREHASPPWLGSLRPRVFRAARKLPRLQVRRPRHANRQGLRPQHVPPGLLYRRQGRGLGLGGDEKTTLRFTHVYLLHMYFFLVLFYLLCISA